MAYVSAINKLNTLGLPVRKPRVLRSPGAGEVMTCWGIWATTPITTTGGIHINTITGSRQQKPRIRLIKSPDLVDHYRLCLSSCYNLSIFHYLRQPYAKPEKQ